MRVSLFWKLMAAFAVVILIGIGGTLFVAGRVTEVEFRRYASGSRWQETVAALTDYYTVNGSWDGVDSVLSRGRGQGRGGSASIRLLDAQGHVVFDHAGGDTWQAEQVDAETGIPIIVGSDQVGTLLLPNSSELTEEQAAFLNRLIAAFAIAGSVALFSALVLGALLVRSITRPLKQLTSASRLVASGNLETRVPIRSRDEVGQLADAFNQMTADLAQAEEARRQQTADIAHDLRTPLTIIQGQVEALADGIFPADVDHLEPILVQTRLLTRLVEDLRTLSLADAGQLMLAPVLTDVQDWLEEAVAGFFAVATEKDIVLSLEVGASVRQVEVDRERLSQVLGNILDNALRYTPDGGQIIVAASLESDDIMITVTDTGPGVSSKQLLHLFERFWRGDPSRSRRTGGSGLGLAVAQQIVEAHGGRIWAENVSTGGLRVRFSLPRK